MRKKIIYAIAAVIMAVLGYFMLGGDYPSFLQWWAVVAFLGIIFMPLTNLIFYGFHDKGYLFSKAIGIAVTGYIMWLLSSLHLLKFTTVSCILCVVVSIIFNVIILIFQNKYKKEDSLRDASALRLTNNTVDHFIAEELMFFALFLLLTYIRGFKPEAYGTEKFMDYGFMTTMMRSDYMPPQDLWFSGTKINYYYVGQYMATFLTKLSYVKVTVGYNIMLMMVGAFAFVLPYSLTYNIILQLLKDRGKKGKSIFKVIPTLSGLFAGAGVCVAGNMHYPTYTIFEPLARWFFGIEANTKKYWFPDATRFIGYHPDTHDKTIHEFPAYSFVLGDLHAHVVNIMFVLTVLAILFAWSCNRRKAMQKSDTPLWKEVFQPAIVLIAFFIGLFHTTNFWDFPIYYIVAGAVILFTNMVVYNFKRKVLAVTALQGIFIFAFSYFVCLPFTLSFQQISTTPMLAVAHTPINQLTILWGLPIITVVAFLCFILAGVARKRKERQAEVQSVRKSFILEMFETIPNSDLFIITIGLCAIGLVLMPEVIYIQDIYSGDYKRANTMFKLTYQAFIMFGICFGYIYLRLLLLDRTRRRIKFTVVGLALFLLSISYIQNAVDAWYGNIFNHKGYKGLDAYAFMETTMPDDKLAIDWLNENITGTPVVLEANGDSYTDYERVSVMTGLPTVLGWHTHEWLWKSDTTLLDERAADIQKIYTSADIIEVRELLKKYNVSYIYVGKLEQEKYTVNNDLLKSLGNVVFSSPSASEKAYETYIVRIQ